MYLVIKAVALHAPNKLIIHALTTINKLEKDILPPLYCGQNILIERLIFFNIF